MRAQTNEKSNAYREVIYPYQRLIAWKNWLNVLNNYTAQVAAGKTDYSLSDMRTAYLQQLSSQLNNTDKIKQVLADTNQTEEALLKILTEKINQAKEKVVAAENKLKSRSYLKTILSLICEHPEFLSGKNAFILCEEGHRTKKQNAFTLNNTMLSIFSQATGIVFLLSECFLQYTVGSRSFMVASSFKTLLSSQNLMRLALFNLPKAHEHHDVSLFMMIKQYAFFINMLIFVGAYLLSEGFNKQSLSKGASTFLWIEACQYVVAAVSVVFVVSVVGGGVTGGCVVCAGVETVGNDVCVEDVFNCCAGPTGKLISV